MSSWLVSNRLALLSLFSSPFRCLFLPGALVPSRVTLPSLSSLISHPSYQFHPFLDCNTCILTPSLLKFTKYNSKYKKNQATEKQIAEFHELDQLSESPSESSNKVQKGIEQIVTKNGIQHIMARPTPLFFFDLTLSMHPSIHPAPTPAPLHLSLQSQTYAFSLPLPKSPPSCISITSPTEPAPAPELEGIGCPAILATVAILGEGV